MFAKFPEATQSDKFRVRTSTGLTFDLEYDTGYFANWDLQGPGYSMEELNTAIVTMLK